jgi:hypothetical protein
MEGNPFIKNPNSKHCVIRMKSTVFLAVPRRFGGTQLSFPPLYSGFLFSTLWSRYVPQKRRTLSGLRGVTTQKAVNFRATAMSRIVLIFCNGLFIDYIDVLFFIRNRRRIMDFIGDPFKRCTLLKTLY